MEALQGRVCTCGVCIYCRNRAPFTFFIPTLLPQLQNQTRSTSRTHGSQVPCPQSPPSWSWPCLSWRDDPCRGFSGALIENAKWSEKNRVEMEALQGKVCTCELCSYCKNRAPCTVFNPALLPELRNHTSSSSRGSQVPCPKELTGPGPAFHRERSIAPFFAEALLHKSCCGARTGEKFERRR